MPMKPTRTLIIALALALAGGGAWCQNGTPLIAEVVVEGNDPSMMPWSSHSVPSRTCSR